jgi:hypothetical protein
MFGPLLDRRRSCTAGDINLLAWQTEYIVGLQYRHSEFTLKTELTQLSTTIDDGMGET